ncbi:hypothetical protein ST47_g7374 [Ascochyta rabiei]|uniref:Uncharacterized protein n=1 Tax=Didymella rabiei TaxID=5454 RepID=A0A163B151_DIDRA|nr:hypothetical protein ST47_g7374 [Ascochyta rabiei]
MASGGQYRWLQEATVLELEVLVVNMSDADMGNVHRSVRPTPRAQQAVGVGQVARRLGYAANSTAQVLYSIANIQNLLTETQSMKQLVQKLYVIALVLSDLTATLVESGEHEVWTEEHDENLLHSLKEFEDIVPAVVRGDYNGVFLLADERKAGHVVDKCFELVVRTGLVARYETLARKEYLDEDEVPEALRLIRAFDGSIIGGIQSYKDGLRDPERLQRYLVPSSITPASSADQTKSARTNFVDSTYIEESKPRGNVPVSAYNQWPPFGNPQYPAYLAAMAKRPREEIKTTVTESSTVLAPNLKAFRESGPSTSRHSTSGLTPQSKPGPRLFWEPVITKSSFSSSSLYGGDLSGSYSRYDQSSASPFAPAPRLEAYILRPTMQSTCTSNTLSHGIELLQLDEEAMQDQIRRLGPEYSVMDSLFDLRPQQLHLLQTHTRHRQGSIVYVQQGKPAGFSTLLGTLQTSPVMFIIQTTTAFAQDPFRASDPTPGRDHLGDTTLATGFKMPNTGSFFSARHHLS